MSGTTPQPIPRRWSSHSQATGDWRMDPEGQWVIWADVREVLEWAALRPPDPADLARWLQEWAEKQPAITIRSGVEPQVAWRALADELLRWQANPVFPEE